MKRVEVTVTEEEFKQLTDQAFTWARNEHYMLAPRKGYIASKVGKFLREVDEAKTPEERARDDELVQKKVEEWERCRATGTRAPDDEPYGIIQRARKLGENQQRVEFVLPVADFIRLRNYAWSQGFSVSVMTRVILGLLDEYELAG